MTPALITWYGDDFTGSTDALEVLAQSGLRAVLFLEKPDAATRDRFADSQAIGLAGISRSQSPEWMSQHLPPIFQWLREQGGAICHYKVCSTFDSSPAIGNIGRALEIGRTVFQEPIPPIIVGAPALGRYTAFGNLFAAAGHTIHRIDRHPAMSHHPVTPMDEADLRLHLQRQTELQIGLINLLEMRAGQARQRFPEASQNGAEAILLDVADDETLLAAGRAIWPSDAPPSSFVLGSSGVEHCLTARWRELGLLPKNVPTPIVQPCDRLVVLSGSCSPATSRQIRQAIQIGYEAIHVDPQTMLGSARNQAACMDTAVAALAAGKSVLLYTALDHQTEVTDRIRFSEDLGTLCGRLLRDTLLRSGARRAVIAGGDTSSHAGKQLGVAALTYLAPLATGAPLCLAYSANTELNGLELVFKGGQIGGDPFFELARTGPHTFSAPSGLSPSNG